MKAIVFEVDRDNPVAAVTVTFAGGRACEPVGLEGISDYTFRRAYHGASVGERIREIGAWLTIETKPDTVELTIQCLSRYLPDAVNVLAAILEGRGIEEMEHEWLAARLRARLRDLTPNDVVDRALARHCRPGYAYSRMSSAASIDRLSPKRALAEFDATARAEGAIISFAGDIASQPCDRFAETVSAALGAGRARTLDALDPPSTPSGRRLVIVDRPGEQARVRLGNLGARWGTPEFDALNSAARGLQRRLHRAIRVDRGWSYDAQCAIERGRGPLWMTIAMSPLPHLAADAIAVALDVYEAFAADGPKPELAPTPGKEPLACFSHASALERAEMRTRALACGLPENLDVCDPWLADFSFADALYAYDHYLQSDQLCAVVMGPADELQSDVERLGWESVVVE